MFGGASLVFRLLGWFLLATTTATSLVFLGLGWFLVFLATRTLSFAFVLLVTTATTSSSARRRQQVCGKRRSVGHARCQGG